MLVRPLDFLLVDSFIILRKINHMDSRAFLPIAFLHIFTFSIYTQEIVQLPLGLTDDAIEWKNPEREYFSNVWNNPVVTNVSQPTLSVYRPDHPNGCAVVICPGGALYALSIDSEGRDVAKWLNQKGVTAFVLKYRLVPTGEDATKEVMEDGPRVLEKARQLLPLAVSDGLNAIEHVRDHADQYQIDPRRIGIIGFSAGGAVTMGATYGCESKNKPDFIGPIYAWMDVVPEQAVPSDAPPMFALCATDDPLQLAPASVKLYSDWIKAGVSAELHMYSKGGHGFGMKKQNLPSDRWIERFTDWMDAQGLLSHN